MSSLRQCSHWLSFLSSKRKSEVELLCCQLETVDPVVPADVLNTSTVSNPHPAMASRKMKKPERDHLCHTSHIARLILKDLGLAVPAGQDAGVALPLGAALKGLYRMSDLRCCQKRTNQQKKMISAPVTKDQKQKSLS